MWAVKYERGGGGGVMGGIELPGVVRSVYIRLGKTAAIYDQCISMQY